jgi:hypothetical protein
MMKRAMDGSTDNFFSAVSIERGITAAELEVEKARSCASRMFRRKLIGDIFPSRESIPR